MLGTTWSKLCARFVELREKERGDVVNWLIITLGIAIAAAAVIAVLRPAIESAGQQIANLVGG